MAISNAQLATRVETLLQSWSRRERQYADWLAGTATGGPNGDGRYELTDGTGVTRLVDCPARLADGVSGPAALAQAALHSAELARDRSVSEATRSAAQAVLGEASRMAAEKARDRAVTAQEASQNHEANALVYRDAARVAQQGTQADRQATVGLAAQVAEDAAEAVQAALDARAAADRANTFDPAAFAPKTHSHTVAQVTGLQDLLDGKSNTDHTHSISGVSGLQTALNAKASLSGGNSWNGGQSFNGGITVKDSLTMTGADPYLRRDNNSSAWVIAGGMGWTDSGAVIVLHGKDHAARPGHVLIYGVDGADKSSLKIDGFRDIYMNRRPSFNGATPWDSANFNPDNKINWSDVNTDGGAYTIVRRNGDGGGFFTGRLHAYSQTATTDVWNSGIEIQEVKNVGNTKGSHDYAPALTFHWKNVAARSIYMNSGGWICFGAQGDKEALLAGIKTNAIATTNNSELHLKWNEDTRMRTHRYGIAVSGNADIENGGIFVRSNAPTITLQDSDHRSAMIHVNDNTFYVLRGAGVNAMGWEALNGRWPMSINLDTNNTYFGASVYVGDNDWFRVRGSSGIYWEDYGGGWNMSDSTWLRAYGGKYIYTSTRIRCDDAFYVGEDRQPRFKSGTGAPSGGVDGDIYFQF